MRSPSAMRMPSSPMPSHSLEQNVDIQGRALAEIVRVSVEKGPSSFSPLVAQEREELPFRIELRRCAKLGHDVVPDDMHAHLGPEPALAVAGIRDLEQERHHSELLQDHGV